MQLSQKPNFCLGIFIAFFRSTLNIEHFAKNIVPDSLGISDIVGSERHGYGNA